MKGDFPFRRTKIILVIGCGHSELVGPGGWLDNFPLVNEHTTIRCVIRFSKISLVVVEEPIKRCVLPECENIIPRRSYRLEEISNRTTSLGTDPDSEGFISRRKGLLQAV